MPTSHDSLRFCQDESAIKVSVEVFMLDCHMQVEEKAIAQLLPYLLEGLKGSSLKEHSMATYMIIMKLIARSTPAAQLYNGALQTTSPARVARSR